MIELREIFKSGVDGANSNLFQPIRINLMYKFILTGRGKEKITINQLYNLLQYVENKQEKDITRYLSDSNN